MAYYEKIVLKLSDLAAMVVHDVSWSEGRRGFTADTPDAEYPELTDAFQMNSYGLDNRDMIKEMDATGIIISMLISTKQWRINSKQNECLSYLSPIYIRGR